MIKHVIQAKNGVRMSTKVHVPDPQPPAAPAEEPKKTKTKQGRKADAQVAENESQEDE